MCTLVGGTTSVSSAARAEPGSRARLDRPSMAMTTPRYMPPPRFTWPHNHRCAAMLCFDVDGETTALSEDAKLASRRTLMSQCEYGPRIGVPRLLGLLAHLN